MNLLPTLPRRQRNGDDRILPLINVVFLLLIFFMIAGHLSASDPFRISPPLSGSATAPDTGSHLILIDRQGRLALDGQPLPEAALLAALSDSPTGATRIKADGDVDAVTVIALTERLRAAGVTRLQLLTIPASE